MSLLKFKSSVVVSRQAILAAGIINAANQLGLTEDIVITSGNDSTHMKGSKHYSDEALDVRTKTLTAEQKHLLKDAVKARLGAGYDVVLESEGGSNEHLHVEYDPS